LIRYAITTPSCYSFEYLKNLEKKADFVLLRDKESKNYAKLAKEFIETTKDFKYKKMLHQDYLLAKELNAFGVHLTSNQFSDIKEAKKLSLFTIISTHTFREIKMAKELGADAITFSPIFNTPNKGKPKGVEVLKEAVDRFNIPIIALGGIVTQKEVELIKKSRAFGFASIRYFC